MRIERVLETAVFVEDMARAVEFYQRVLHFKVLMATPEPVRLTAMDVGGSHILLLFKAGETWKDVTFSGGRIPGFAGNGPGHVAFPIPVADLEAWEKHLTAHGVSIESKVTWELGGKSVYFRDPDKNLLELATPGVWKTY